LCSALYRNGRIEEALVQYEIVARLLPYDARAHADLGSMYEAKGFYDEAIEQFEIALRLRSDLGDVHYNLGVAYQRKRLLDQSLEHLEAAARLDPSDMSIRDELARTYSLRNSR
jgi:tetratricopeptide (TPR) repeat protein